jgi:hypothetical protein
MNSDIRPPLQRTESSSACNHARNHVPDTWPGKWPGKWQPASATAPGNNAVVDSTVLWLQSVPDSFLGSPVGERCG